MAWKLVEGPQPELYDLHSDPGELLDLARRNAEIADDLRQELASRRSAWERTGGPSGSALAAADPATLERLASLGYVGGLSTTPSSSGPDPRRLAHLETPIREGRRRMKSRDWAGALAHFRTALAEDPDNRYVLDEACKAALALGDLEAALGWAERLTQRSPEVATGWIVLADIRLARDDTGGAAEAAASGLPNHPDDPTLRFQRGLALVRAGRSTEAVREVVATMARDRAGAWPNLRLLEAAARARMGDAAGATAALERAVADGFRNRPLVESDAAFAPLRALPAYRRLLPA